MNDRNLDGIFDTLRDIARETFRVGGALGIRMPLDRQIANLRAKRDQLKKLRFRAEASLKFQVAKIQVAKTPRAAEAWSELKILANKAMRKTPVSIQYYAQAIISAQKLQEMIARAQRQNLPQMLADFEIKRTLAEREGDLNISMYKTFFDTLDRRWNQIMEVEISIIKEAAKIPGAVAREAARKAGIIIRKAQPFAAAAPWLIGGGLLLYGLTMARPFLPRRR